VSPRQDFVGDLVVPVSVNDGHTSSLPFNLVVSVLDIIHIKGQQPVTIEEDGHHNINMSSLVVHDPKGQFPSGYSLKVSEGENYTFSKTDIRPVKDFTGTLNVTITISNGKDTSPPYAFRITVTPVNDAPSIEKFPSQNLIFATGNDSSFVMPHGTVLDADDTQLSMAQVSILAAGYERGFDQLKTNVSSTLSVSFNVDDGTLYIQGPASLNEYTRVLQSITYYYTTMDGVAPKPKTVVVKVTDGKEYSQDYTRRIKFTEEVQLDIPNAFTPNNDNANDTWNVRPLRNNDAYEKAIIRVFNKNGVQVFESLGFQNPWDGRYRGQVLPSDTYYYIIDFRLSSFSQSLKGVVSILR
jgi:gliding motility-associated-like protein